MKDLLWTETFTKKFKRLVRQNPRLRTLIKKRLQQLSEDPFHPSLRSHKLKGNLSGIWSCYIDYNYRILFKFIKEKNSEEDNILLMTLGSHDEVY